jgi:hypothetical protein
MAYQSEVLALPLAYLVNMSYATGTVPDVFKKAKVHPVHKAVANHGLSPAHTVLSAYC